MHDRLDARAACLFMTADPQWRRKLFVGGLVLMMPVVGWAMVLGYRKLAVDRILSGAQPLLPDWRGNLAVCLVEGIKCCGVITAYLFPASILAWWALRTADLASGIPWFPLLGFLLVFPVFSPLALPVVVAYAAVVPDAPLAPAIALGIVAAYALLVFLIPLGFLRVSSTGSYLSAFNIVECLRFLLHNSRRYVAAWFHSSVISLMGHFCVPFSPWGIVWAYLGIVYCFNEVHCGDPVATPRNIPEHSWYSRISHWSTSMDSTRTIGILRRRVTDEGNEFHTVKLGRYELPLPRVLAPRD